MTNDNLKATWGDLLKCPTTLDSSHHNFLHRSIDDLIATIEKISDLDALEAAATAALMRTYGDQPRAARFWMQKGIEGMRYAVADAKEEAMLAQRWVMAEGEGIDRG